jgi:hypothetical protein
VLEADAGAGMKLSGNDILVHDNGGGLVGHLCEARNCTRLPMGRVQVRSRCFLMRRLDFDVNNQEVEVGCDVLWSEPNYVCLNGPPSVTLRLAEEDPTILRLPIWSCNASLDTVILDLDLPYTSAVHDIFTS